MALAEFFSRTADAIMPVAQIGRNALAQRLDDVSVTLVAGGHVTSDGPMRAGFVFAANLLARLYPRVSVVGPDQLCDIARTQMHDINPHIADDAKGHGQQ